MNIDNDSAPQRGGLAWGSRGQRYVLYGVRCVKCGEEWQMVACSNVYAPCPRCGCTLAKERTGFRMVDQSREATTGKIVKGDK